MKKRVIIGSLLFLLFMFGIFYFTLPALNFKSGGFYFFLALFIGFIVFIVLYLNKENLINKSYTKTYKVSSFDRATGRIQMRNVSPSEKFTTSRLALYSFSYAILGYVVLMIIFGIIGSKLFRAKAFYEQLDIETGTQEEFNTAFNYDSGDVLLPIIDKDLAFKLAQANLGNYGAQYSIDYDNFTLISVNRDGSDQLVRIAPLEYSNFFVSLNRLNEGTIGYIEVNVVTKETKLITFDKGLKYMPSAILSKDLDRHIRFNYPDAMYDTKNFEIDDQGNPYWVIPTYTNQIGVINGATPTGTIIVDPISGKTNRYSIGEEPLWVDRVASISILETQATNALIYKNGFFNMFIGQKKEVFQLSDGYNYFIKNGHTYYVSCITSPNESDQTSIGFVTIDLKTKETKKYLINGITEMRAREISQMDARVKAQNLTSTWPILIDYQGVETYFLVLKNDVQSQKIVFINVKNGEQIAMGDTISQAKSEYDKLLVNSGNTVSEDKEYSGRITNIRDLGTTIEFMIDSVDNKYFVVKPDLSLVARFIKVSDVVTITCKEYEEYLYVTNIVK